MKGSGSAEAGATLDGVPSDGPAGPFVIEEMPDVFCMRCGLEEAAGWSYLDRATGRKVAAPCINDDGDVDGDGVNVDVDVLATDDDDDDDDDYG